MIPDYRVGPAEHPGAPLAGDEDDDELPAAGAAGPAGLSTPEAQALETRRLQVPESFHAQRLDKLLVHMAPEFSRNHLQGLIGGGHVLIEGKPADGAARKLRAGQLIELVLWPTEESRAFRAEAIPVDIAFEDEAMLVVNKPAGLVVHPAAGNWSGTLLNALLAHHPASASLPRAGIVHRLDKDTSGLMVVGKTLAAVTALSRAIAAREVHRQYLAIVHGVLREASMQIDAPIARDPRSRIRMAVVAGGRQARTDVQLLVHDEEYSGVRCTLHTGRTHQIRVHLASRGHPLVSDALYGGQPMWGLARQALHATRLGLAHPVSGEQMVFDAPLPPDLSAAWRHLG